MSGGYPNAAAANFAPTGRKKSYFQRIAGTGSTEASNAVKLPIGHNATLLIGKTDVRLAFRSETGVTGAVDATTDLEFATRVRYDWTVTEADCVVYMEASDGASAFEAWVWSSSPEV